MEINLPSKLISNRVSEAFVKVPLDSMFHSMKDGSLLIGLVLQKFSTTNEYLINTMGRQIRLQSESKLMIGERLELGVQKIGSKIELEVINRSLGIKEKQQVDYTKGWSKNYLSVPKTIQQLIEPIKAELSFQKIMLFLEVYFPGIQWNESTRTFYWKFEDAEAEAYYGKTKDRYSFYLHYESKAIGAIDSYFYSEKKDFSDFVLHCVFGNLAAYFHANENLNELKKMLSSNSISANDIIFHYSTIDTTKKGDWII